MAEIDWNTEAQRAANHFYDNHMEAHRGATPWESVGVTVMFGNDGHNLAYKTKREVELVRACLKSLGIDELGFGVAGDGYTWALLARTDRHEGLNNLVWVAWEHARADDLGAPIPDAVVDDIIERSAIGLVMDVGVPRSIQQRIAEASILGDGTPLLPSIN